jgi:hypothetical protein
MSRKESQVRDQDGELTHIRVTSEDGTRSDLYEAKEGFWGVTWGEHVEIADHYSDGRTKAYEVDKGIIFPDSRGKRKS